MAGIKKRKVLGYRVTDVPSVENMTFSEKAGARKVAEVGRKLLPLNINATTYTTDASTARALPSAGRNLAIYNNSAAVHAVTFGEDLTIAALAAGAVDASGHVGIACTPNAWTYVAAGEQISVITDSATLLVYLIDDDTAISLEASR
jgi:hypothetical protein